MAAAEIDRVGGDPRFVQVLLPVRSLMPYGNRNHLPTFDAAVRNELAVALHFGGASGNPPTSTGWPTRYIEEYVDMASVFQSQLMNVIAEGVFDRHPGLRMVHGRERVRVAAGLPVAVRPAVAWAAPRDPLDEAASRRRWCASRCGLTLQPIDGPAEPEAFRRLLELLGSDELLLFSTDYPHHHFDTPRRRCRRSSTTNPAPDPGRQRPPFYRLDGGADG